MARSRTDVKEAVVGSLRAGGYEVALDVPLICFADVSRTAHALAVDAQGGLCAVVWQWQDGSGTTEEKVPFKVLWLSAAVRDGRCKSGYIVLAGNGWKCMDYFLSPSFTDAFRDGHLLRVVTLGDFIELASEGRL